MNSRLTFGIADTPDEFEAVHALNYRSFVEEIPQHAPNSERRLVDKFHGENIYLIACDGVQLVGMLALRDRRPFSLDAKLPDLDAHLPAGRRWAEVRLLAVEREWRGTGVLPGLLRLLDRECRARGLDAAVVSATTRQRRLYEHLGFESFGPLVGSDGAWYQPMHLLAERFRKAVEPHLRRQSVNLLPGPVALPAAVRRAFRGAPVSHRAPEFYAQVCECRAALRALTGAPHVALLPGGGTMANEVVCEQIALLDAPGIVVSHGEFGERLADHARRARLQHHHWQQPWGTPLDLAALGQWLDAHPATRWLWAVHCETSTGMSTPIHSLLSLCEPRGVRLCLDCVSSLGVLPVNLRGVHLAASTSGKGLAAVAGVGIVFHHDVVQPEPDRVPRALDLGLYEAGEGVPFTLGSNVIAALHAALTRTDWPAKIGRVAALGAQLRDELGARGMKVVDPCSTAVITVALPRGVSAIAIAVALEERGWLVAARSRHLHERGWLQFCLMGEINAGDLAGLADATAAQSICAE